MSGSRVTADGWTAEVERPPGTTRTVLLIPGFLATATSMKDIARSPALLNAHLAAVCATVPGCGGTAPLKERGAAALGRSAAELARVVGAGLILGHSYGGEVAIEAAAEGGYHGRLLLLSPEFSAEKEMPRWQLTAAVGLAKVGAWGIRSAPALRERWWFAGSADGFAQSNVGDLRQLDDDMISYLNTRTSPASRLCQSGVKTWILCGEKEKGPDSEDLQALTSCPSVTLLPPVEGAGHMLFGTHPERIASAIVDVMGG